MNSNRQRGFTLVELMVVIVVLVILASMTVVSYRMWRSHTAETAVKSDLNSLVSAMENARNWGEGYPVISSNTKFTDSSPSTKNIFVQSDHTVVTYKSGNLNGYCAEATSKDVPSIKYFVNTNSSNKKVQQGICS